MKRSAILAASILTAAAAVPLVAEGSAQVATEPPAPDQQQPFLLPLRPELRGLGRLGLPTDRVLSGVLDRVRVPATGTSLDGLVSGSEPDAPSLATPAIASRAQGDEGPHVSGGPHSWKASTASLRAGRTPGAPTPAPQGAVDRPAGDGERLVTLEPAKAPASTWPAARERPRARPGRESGDRRAHGLLGAVEPWFRAVSPSVPGWSRPIILALFFLLLIFGVRSSVVAARARGLARQRELLLGDVGALQRALLPEVPDRIGDLSVSVAYEAAEGPGAGGDFYDVFRLPEGRVGLILGDVCGHGRDALERATLTRYTVRAFVEAGLEPRTALKVAEATLGEDGRGGFASVAVAVFDPATDVLTYALAGHPPPLLLGAGLAEPMTACSSSPLGLGLPTGLRQTSVSLPAGAIVCFFTDGLVEARADGAMLGRENLERLVMRLGRAPDAGNLLLRALREAADRSDDDMAACLLWQHGGAGRAAQHVEELEVERGATDGRGPAAFLTACGVTPDAASRALEAARSGARDAAMLMRVALDGPSGSVEVLPVNRQSFHPGTPDDTPGLHRADTERVAC